LQAILVTLNMLRINYERSKNIDKITKQLASLAKDFDMFNGEWSKFSRTIETISGDKTKLDKRVFKIGDRFNSIEQYSGAEIEDKTEDMEPNKE
jgi:DNA anti-recombination protein RmuC